MRQTLALFCLCCGISSGIAGAAQEPVSAAPPSTPPAQANDKQPNGLESIDFVAHDRKGRPVTDLKPEELTVTDAGAPVKIASLRLVGGVQASPHLVALVFGRLDSAALKNARAAAAKVLKMFPGEGFAFAVFGVDGRLHLFAAYGADRAAIGRAIESATMARPADREAASAPREKSLLALAQATRDAALADASSEERDRANASYLALQRSQLLVDDRHVQPDIAGLTAIAEAERQLPGRKAIVYFAQSAEADTDTVDQMRAAAKAANEAGISILSIDMNALDPAASNEMATAAAMGSLMTNNRLNPPSALNGPPSGFHTLMTPAQMKQMNDTIGDFEADGMAGRKGPLCELSAQTGGKCAGFRDGLKKPVQQLVADQTSYYEVSYASKIEIYDGRFHPVAVKPRRAGLSVRATAGYLALPRNEEFAAKSIDAALLKAFNSPTPPSGIDYRSAVLQFGRTKDGISEELAMEIPVANLNAREDPNTQLFSLHAAVAARVEDQSGRVVKEFSEDIRRHGGLDSLDTAREGFISFQRHLVLAPGNYVFKSVVVDSNSENAGGQNRAVHIGPSPGSPSADPPSLSDIILVRQTDNYSANDSADPLRSGRAKLVPNLAGNVSADAKNVSLFFMAHSAEKTSAPAMVAVALSKDGKQFGKWPLHVANGREGELVPYFSSLNAQTLPAGRYEITVSLKQGAESVERNLTFVKEGGNAKLAARDPATDTAAHTADADAAKESSGPSLEEISGALPKTSPGPAVAPPAQQIEALIESARKRALGYSTMLPNFMCVETIDRSVDRSGKGRWTHRDNLVELLRYRDSAESRVVLEVDGHRSSVEPADIKGARSNGEFGGLLKAIFEPKAAAAFQWQAQKELDNSVVQVFSYRVAQKNSTLGLTDSTNWTLNVAFHGVLYIEPETGAVRYATAEAQDLPATFGIHKSLVQVEYDYIAINSHDYLLPVRGAVSLREGRREAVLNTLRFRDYKRFGSQSRMLAVAGPQEKPAASSK